MTWLTFTKFHNLHIFIGYYEKIKIKILVKKCSIFYAYRGYKYLLPDYYRETVLQYRIVPSPIPTRLISRIRNSEDQIQEIVEQYNDQHFQD